MKKMDSMELNYIKDNSGSWNFSSNDQYVCFLSVLNDILPVVKFKISSAVSSYFSMELFVISQKKIDFNNIYKKEAVLCLFFDQTTKKYEKEIVAKIYKIYIQGESYFLNQQAISTSVKTYYYKIVLYPNLYELTFKERNYIHKGNSKANEVELITKFDVAKKVLTSEYGYNLAIKSNGIILDEIKKEESITQYQESDYNFVLRILEDIDLILYYDFKDKTPNLIIASETSFAISEKIQLQKAQAIQQIYELDQIQELFISDNGQFNAICSSYNLFAGCVFSIENDSINSYFVIESDMFLEYKENGQWELKNYINGVIIGNKLLKKRAIPKLFTGTIRGIVVSNKKNTFNVDQNGRIQVRFLWNTQIFNKEGGKKQDINDNQKEIENGWDLNYNKSNVTTWIPLAHWGAAGRLYGNFNYPRSGSEVLISFYEGNLDLPIVMGTIFNNQNPLPNVKSFMNNPIFKEYESKKVSIKKNRPSAISNELIFSSLFQEVSMASSAKNSLNEMKSDVISNVANNFPTDQMKNLNNSISSDLFGNAALLAGSASVKPQSDIVQNLNNTISNDLLEQISFATNESGAIFSSNIKNIFNKNLIFYSAEFKNLQYIPTGYPNEAPSISDTSADMILKYYSYDSSKETKTDRFNEISMHNKYKEEQLNIISSNLINFRSKKMHLQVDNNCVCVYTNQTETILKDRNTYVFGQEFNNYLNSNKITYFFECQKLPNEEIDESYIDLMYGKSLGQIIPLLPPGALDGVYDLSIYDSSKRIDALFKGDVINVVLSGNVFFYSPLGTFWVVTNIINFTSIVMYTETVLGYKTTKVALYYMISVVKNMNIHASKIDLIANTLSIKAALSMNISARLNLIKSPMNIKCANVTLKAAANKITTKNFSIKCTKFELMGANASLDLGSCVIDCVDFSITAAKININCSIFSLKAAVLVSVKAGIVTLG